MRKIYKKIKLNITHLIMSVCLGLIILSFLFTNQMDIQVKIVVLGVLIYITFALTHHYFDKSLTFETVFEYILIALLVLIVVVGSIL